MPPDFQLAADYFSRAAARGNPSALSQLAWMHDNAKLGPRNVELAILLYETAVKRAPTLNAQYNLGLIFKDDKKDFDKAAQHFRYSALAEDEDAKTKLWALFQAHKTKLRVCLHAAIAFHKVGTPEQKTATRAAFNELLKTNVGIVNDCYSEEDSPDDIQALIDLDENELEKVRILFNIIRSPDLLINDMAAIVLAFVNPIGDSNKVAKEEVEASQFLTAQKSVSSCHMVTLFGAQPRHHRAIIKDAEDCKISYSAARKKIKGR